MGKKNSSTRRTGKGKESDPTDASSLENFHSRYENEQFLFDHHLVLRVIGTQLLILTEH